MRVGVVWVPCSNAYYRAIEPVTALARRGHEVVAPPDGEGEADPVRLAGCDVVHIFRRCDERTRRIVADLVRAGTPITYDNDDDFTAVPKEAPEYKRYGGLEGQRGFARSVKMAKLAQTFTTTNEVLADKYRGAGVERVEVIGNYVGLDAARPRIRHDGVVIGWVAGLEHMADVARIGIADALQRVVAKHDDVRVECIGVDLRLPERYTHRASVHFRELAGLIAGFDIGIAPLADLPLNRARSDVKLKEYAACGVPWLASPVGPYAQMGEAQGGQLVADDGWFEALDRLVSNRRERRRLARSAEAWGKSQTIDSAVERWERVLLDAAGRNAAGAGATPGFSLGSGVDVRVRPRSPRGRREGRA